MTTKTTNALGAKTLENYQTLFEVVSTLLKKRPSQHLASQLFTISQTIALQQLDDEERRIKQVQNEEDPFSTWK